MSKDSWTHAVCGPCWAAMHPDREPDSMRPELAKVDTCCYCGHQTQMGIYVRDDPKVLHGDVRFRYPHRT